MGTHYPLRAWSVPISTLEKQIMTVLQDYFEQQLVEFGFLSDLEINYSLSYCQGDGMAFYGDLDLDSLIGLFNKMNPLASDKAQRRFTFLAKYITDNEADAEVSITRNHFGNHYSHYNTMTLVYPLGEYLELLDIRLKDRPILRKIWDEFITQLKSYIKETSKQLAAIGYQIIESVSIDARNATEIFDTENYRIEFKIEPIHFYEYSSAEEFGYYDVNALCNDALHGMKFLDISAVVTQKQLGIKMGESTLSYCSYDDNDKSYAGNKHYLIRDAIREARKFAHLTTQTVQKLRPVAVH